MVTLSALLLTSILAAPEDTVLLEFSSPNCHHCRVMQTTVDRLQEKGYPVRVVNVEREPQLAQQFRARFLPTFILVHKGQEVARHEGATSFSRLAGMFDKIGTSDPPTQNLAVQSTGRPNQDRPNQDRPNQDRLNAAQTRVPFRTPDQGSVGLNGGGTVRGQTPGRIMPSLILPSHGQVRPTAPSSEDRPHLVENRDAQVKQIDSLQRGSPESAIPPENLALDATVRIKVIDAGGHSFGTGTIVDAHDDFALVLTAGHLFRGSQASTTIEVELFAGSGNARTVAGKVIAFDADKRDIGLVEIRPGVPVRPVPVANDVAVLRNGAPVFTIGCNHGADPTLVRSRIAAVDKYIGFPNIEVQGQPVQGRSGGGLFTAAGELIGVCNAADPEDNEGIYAGLPMIHEELASVGIESSALPAQANPPTRADNIAFQDSTPANSGTPQVNRGEQAQVDDLLPPGVSQLVVYVRTRENPSGEQVVIDNPTEELLAQLRQRRPAPTSIAAPRPDRTALADDQWNSIR
jgi:thiol-disulfide isomerase/thioredoxin